MYKIRLDSGNACHVGLSCTLIHIYNNPGVQSGVKRFGLSGFCRISDAEIAHCLVVPLTSKAVHLHRGHVELAKLYRSAGSVQAASGCYDVLFELFQRVLRARSHCFGGSPWETHVAYT